MAAAEPRLNLSSDVPSQFDFFEVYSNSITMTLRNWNYGTYEYGISLMNDSRLALAVPLAILTGAARAGSTLAIALPGIGSRGVSALMI